MRKASEAARTSTRTSPKRNGDSISGGKNDSKPAHREGGHGRAQDEEDVPLAELEIQTVHEEKHGRGEVGAGEGVKQPVGERLEGPIGMTTREMSTIPRRKNRNLLQPEPDDPGQVMLDREKQEEHAELAEIRERGKQGFSGRAAPEWRGRATVPLLVKRARPVDDA